MKIYFSILLLALFISCKKDNEVKGFKKEIAGTWELASTSGMGGYNPQPPGNGQIIVLGESGSFERKKHDTLLFSGNYMVTKKKDTFNINQLQSFIDSTYQYSTSTPIREQRELPAIKKFEYK